MVLETGAVGWMVAGELAGREVMVREQNRSLSVGRLLQVVRPLKYQT